MSRLGANNTVPDEGPNHLQSFQQMVKKWDELKNDPAHFDPSELLCEMAGILEKAQDLYLIKDPDPFEERHPSRINPECPFGLILKCFFKKESLVAEIFTNYMRENYFTRLGQSKSSFDLNVAACRVLLGILPGLEIQVLADTEGLIKRLYDWAEESKEPLQSYATGLLAVAMEISETTADLDFRLRNDRLIPKMLKRLKSFGNKEETSSDIQHNFKRPFEMFSTGSTRRPSSDPEELKSLNNPGLVANSIPSPVHVNSLSNGADWSNSSWAEMESQLIGHFPIHPLTDSAKQVFILRYLQPLAEYQEFLQHIVDENIRDLLYDLMNLRENRNARLSFESLRFLCALFCHKKICLEWVQSGGIQILVNVPRPSIAATAVSQCLYYLSCDDPSMEKICQLPQPILHKMIQYILWLIECSHESGKQWAVNCFGIACNFKILLGIIDELDGIRRLYNLLSTLPILSNDDNTVLTDDEEYAQRQCLRCVVVALKRYFETHLALKVDQIRRAHQIVQSVPSHLSHFKPIRCSAMQIIENIETMFELMPFKTRWAPVDNFIQLGGVIKIFQVIASAIDWTFPGRSEMVKSALELLSVCSISPRAQLIFCERIDLLDDSKSVAFNILLGAGEGELVQDSADVQRAALNVIINCVCAPINRPTTLRPAAIAGSSSSKKKALGKTSEDLINKIWDCVRSNNGIMTLMQLLHTKTPITDADSIRALACRALVGLARSQTARQIMSKLPIFTSGELQQLVREPVLQDKRTEHVKFQQHAMELIKKVSGPGGNAKLPGDSDFSLEMMHRASVVAQTKITFSKKQLLQLIQEYLSSQGLHESAGVLNREASLALMTSKHLTHKIITAPTTPAMNGPRPPLVSNSPTPLKSTINTPPFRPQTAVQPAKGLARALATPTMTPTTPPSAIRIKRRHDGTPTVTPSSAKIVQKAFEPKTFPEFSELQPIDSESGSAQKISLVSIVSDYLSAQHSLCKNPMATCPEFDLFVHHKCPDPRPKHSAPWNFTTRMMKRQLFPPYGGPEGRKLDRKLLYSRFRPIRTFRCSDEQETVENTFYSCAIMPPDDTFVLAGTYLGDVKMFNLKTGTEESTYNCHDSQVTHLQVNRDGSLLLTSSPWRAPYSRLWSLGEFFEAKLTFKDDDYVEFSKVSQDKIIATQNENASIYDITTGQKIMEFKPTISNNYAKNRATFDPTDDLVLNDGVLYDTRCGREIQKLDKLNQNLNGVFHPNGLEIVSNTEVWDIRTFHLLKTVPGLDQCQVKFSNSGDIIYAVTLEQETDDGEKFDSAFKTFDSHDYSNIATIETRRGVVDVATSANDLQLAVVENSLSPQVREESVVRLYDVGRLKAGDEDYDDREDEDEENAEGDDDGEGVIMGDDEEDDEDEEDFQIGSGSESDDDFQLFGNDDDDDEDEDDDDEDDDEEEEEEEVDDDEDNAVVDAAQVVAAPGNENDNDNEWEDIEDDDMD